MKYGEIEVNCGGYRYVRVDHDDGKKAGCFADNEGENDWKFYSSMVYPLDSEMLKSLADKSRKLNVKGGWNR